MGTGVLLYHVVLYGVQSAVLSLSKGLQTLRVYNHANSLGVLMKIILNVVGIILILAGGTFFLQGINILPGSYMTGDPRWAIIGGVMVLIAIGLLFSANRR